MKQQVQRVLTAIEMTRVYWLFPLVLLIGIVLIALAMPGNIPEAPFEYISFENP